MIKVSILKQGVVTNQATFDTQLAANAWLNQEIANRSFGKSDRWVRENQEDVSQATDTRQVEVQPAQEEVIDEETQEVIREASEAIVVTEYFLPAEYIIEQEDITAQVEQEVINAEALAYLASTDYIVVRSVENPLKHVPIEIAEARQAARDRIVR